MKRPRNAPKHGPKRRQQWRAYQAKRRAAAKTP